MSAAAPCADGMRKAADGSFVAWLASDRRLYALAIRATFALAFTALAILLATGAT